MFSMTNFDGCKRKQEYNPDDMFRGTIQARQFIKKFSEMPLDKMDTEQGRLLVFFTNF